MDETETVFILSKRSRYYFNRKGLEGQEDVWDIPAPNCPARYRHAAPFPEALVSRCLQAACPRRAWCSILMPAPAPRWWWPPIGGRRRLASN